MKKVLCIFAHPDDESFGPGGTIAKWAKEGAEIHILCATRGQNGSNHTKKETAHIRSAELKKAAKILGVKKVTFLDFTDGCICNHELQHLMEKITQHVKSFKPDILMTFDLNGVSGHIDHIAVASAVTKVFNDTKVAQKLYYYNVSKYSSDQEKDYFIYFPDGKNEDEVDEVVDISGVYDIQVAAMKAHVSQMKDVEKILKKEEDQPKQELFVVKTVT